MSDLRGRHGNHARGLDHYAAQAWEPPCSESFLREAYFDHHMTQAEIARSIGVSLKRIQTAMRRFGITPRPQVKRYQSGEANASWRGDDATYAAFHKRVEALRGKPDRCEACGTESAARFEWANLTGDYSDPDDYAAMCVSCHRRYDNERRRVGLHRSPPSRKAGGAHV